MKNPIILTLFLFFISCSENATKDDKSSNPILGNWEGFEIYRGNSTDSLEFKGYFTSDLIIRTDTIYRIDYPTKLSSKFTYYFQDDSIIFKENNDEIKYKWTLSDSLMSLVKLEQNSILEKRTYRKRKFNNSIVDNLIENYINEELLHSLFWKFDYPSTKRFGWEDIDTNVFAPPTDTYFSSSGQLKYDSLIISELDTFKYVHFQKLGFMDNKNFLLQIEKKIKDQKVIFNYTSVEIP